MLYIRSYQLAVRAWFALKSLRPNSFAFENIVEHDRMRVLVGIDL